MIPLSEMIEKLWIRKSGTTFEKDDHTTLTRSINEGFEFPTLWTYRIYKIHILQFKGVIVLYDAPLIYLGGLV